ncbi:MAG: helix-turn-helix transcriptional regulator [Clostridia bacterium]|nr:helix-turn-helix transcriptional regulator [Clostridia bacterium]
MQYTLNKVLMQKWRQASFSYLDQPRPDHGLLLVLRGRIDFVTPTERLSAKAGDLLFLPKGSCYEARFYEEAENYLVNFEGDAPCNVPTLLMQNALCREQFCRLEEERFSSFFRREGLFYLLLDEVFTHRTSEDRTLEQARALLAEGKGVAEVAAACHISESGLRRLFQAKLGVSPAHCRTEVRLARAMDLLESGALSVNEVAEQLGFYDAAYFCRIFKKFLGVTPAQYAKKKRRSL